MLEHRVVGGEIELARDLDALRSRLHAMEFYAVIEHHFLTTRQSPEEIEMPPRPAVFAIGRKHEAQFLLFLDDRLDFAILCLAQLRSGDFPLLAPGTRLLDGRAAQDRTDVVGAEWRLAALH